MPDLNTWMFEQIQTDIRDLQQQILQITQKSERSETAGGLQSYSYADRPLAATGGVTTDTQSYVDLIFCYDARKGGEGVGAGTGVPCYYDPAVDDYRRFEDNAILSV